jgi:hypothetical protein
MMTFIPPRLRKPGIYALAGLLFSAAWLVQGGRVWWVSIPALIGTVAGTVRLYRVGGTDTTRATGSAPGPMRGSSWSACGPGPWPAT